MKLSDKLSILIGPQLYRHSSDVDGFLTAVMRDGNLLGTTNNGIFLHIELHGRFYKLWLANAWYADLTACFTASPSGVPDEYLYNMCRPSRMMKLKFWKWLDGKGISPLQDKDYDNAQVKNNISSAIFAYDFGKLAGISQ